MALRTGKSKEFERGRIRMKRRSTFTGGLVAALMSLAAVIGVAPAAQAGDYKICTQLSNGQFCAVYTVSTSGRIDKIVDTYTKTGGSGASLRMGYDYVNCTTLARYSQWTGATFTQKPGTSVSRTFYPASPPSGKPSVCVRGLLVDTIAGVSFTTAIGHFGLN